MKRRKVLAKYNELIALADTAFRTRSYLLSRDTYLEADALSTGATYPQERISEINKLMDTQKWASIAEEYNAYIQQADGAKSHAIARFYYKKALEVKKDDTYAKEKLTEVEAFISERKGKTVDL
ncbi:hypothetical protein FACS1894121_1050 [Bacteroidia bacterium]|nr:hypothetical protein FACS1894121_1050 [Bacteroidia bacterium]